LYKDDSFFDFEEEFGTDEASMDAAYPDGLYSVRLVMKNGAVCPFLREFIGGGWPDFCTVSSPADLATGVSRTPTVSWSYGDPSKIAWSGVDLWSEALDEDYRSGLILGSTTTTLAWANFQFQEVSELPAMTLVDMITGTESFQGRVSNNFSQFTTGP
jgi:hypothetical protein